MFYLTDTQQQSQQTKGVTHFHNINVQEPVMEVKKGEREWEGLNQSLIHWGER